MVNNFRLFLESTELAADKFILGNPSGEVIYVDINIISYLVNNEFIKWERILNKQLVNCYCYDDRDRDDIIKYIQNIKPIGKINVDKLAEEFRIKTSKIVSKEVIVAYERSYGYDYYYAIIPDLTINKNYYERVKDDLNKMIKEMGEKNYGSFFFYKERLIGLSKVKYYGPEGFLG